MGKVVAVVGDPGSGKSVFSYLLFKELVLRNVKVFRQEGDPSAPTSPWYLEARDRRLADELRRRVKSPWDERKVKWVSESLANLKRVFDVVILDAGGGMPPRERVTRENAEILKHADAAIIICRKDSEDCVEGWTRELREKAPHVKILLVCKSDLHGQAKFGGGECVIPGLDRSLAANPREDTVWVVGRVADYLLSKLHEI